MDDRHRRTVAMLRGGLFLAIIVLTVVACASTPLGACWTAAPLDTAERALLAELVAEARAGTLRDRPHSSRACARRGVYQPMRPRHARVAAVRTLDIRPWRRSVRG